MTLIDVSLYAAFDPNFVHVPALKAPGSVSEAIYQTSCLSPETKPPVVVQFMVTEVEATFVGEPWVWFS